MPLASQHSNAHVIIHELEQPHRFEYALQCSCGFQHHGFASPSTKTEDKLFDMKESAKFHLAYRHGISPELAHEKFEVAPFKTPGGLAHDQLKLRVDAAKATTQAQEFMPGIPQAPAPKGVVTQMPAKPVQSGGVKK